MPSEGSNGFFHGTCCHSLKSCISFIYCEVSSFSPGRSVASSLPSSVWLLFFLITPPSANRTASQNVYTPPGCTPHLPFQHNARLSVTGSPCRAFCNMVILSLLHHPETVTAHFNQVTRSLEFRYYIQYILLLESLFL